MACPCGQHNFETASAYNEHVKNIGPFQFEGKGVVQIVPTASDIDLLTNPAGPEQGAGSGDLIYHGGPTIIGGRFFNIYLGGMNFSVTDFDAFTKAICEHGYYLSPDSRDFSPTQFLGSKQLPTNPLPASVADINIQGWLDSAIKAGQLPADDGKTMYSLIFPAGTTVTLSGQSSCSSFCGYHSKTSIGNHYYQVICDSQCSGCHGSFAVNDGRMMVQAHEYSEWRSDPDGTAWFDSAGWENADKCAWNRVAWGPTGANWCVQPQWVNGKGCYTGVYDGGTPPPPPPPPVGSHIITATSLNGGAITPTGSVTVPDGANQTFNAVPASGYVNAGFIVDGVTLAGSTYTFMAVKANHSIVAMFKASAPPPVALNCTFSWKAGQTFGSAQIMGLSAPFTGMSGKFVYSDGKSQIFAVGLSSPRAGILGMARRLRTAVGYILFG